MSIDLKAAVQAEQEDMVSVRRDLHAHPELSFKEERTAGLIAERLTGIGLAGLNGNCLNRSCGTPGGLRAWPDAHASRRY